MRVFGFAVQHVRPRLVDWGAGPGWIRHDFAINYQPVRVAEPLRRTPTGYSPHMPTTPSWQLLAKLDHIHELWGTLYPDEERPEDETSSAQCAEMVGTREPQAS
jgi:hypothetical protein